MRNLVVCCDGTWNTREQRDGGVPVPTNVVRLYNALAQRGAEGVEQLKYYHPGVGTEPGLWDKAAGGATGAGLNRNIMSAYQWLCWNYQSGDRIFLFGFSRGAYTVRSLAGFVTCCGLLKVVDLEPKEVWGRIDRVFQRGYRERLEQHEDWRQWAFHENGGAEDIPIHMVGVWDTVGALGIPDELALLNLLDSVDPHAFHDTELSPSIRHARHAVALDELRASFQPALWTGAHPDVKQVWFPGVHCDVGGGYRETGLSDGALKWMLDEAQAVGLRFIPDMLEQVKPNPRDVLHDSYTDLFKLLKSQPRSAPFLDVDLGDVPDQVRTLVHPSAIERRRRPPINHAPYRETVPKVVRDGQNEVTVYALNPWNETGLYLERGATYRFRATGEWLDRSIACGPGGTSDGDFQPAEAVHLIGTALGELESLFKKVTGNQRADFRFTKRHERVGGQRVPWFCLMGAIANGGAPNEEGKPTPHETFMIGDGCDHTPQRSGYLYAYANDAWNFYENNRGSVHLVVTRIG